MRRDTDLSRCLSALAVVAALWLHGDRSSAHDGPPYPIVIDRVVGALSVSVWSDPDTTDDGSAGGQFWVILAPVSGASPVEDPRVTVAVQSAEHPEARGEIAAAREGTDTSRWFAALPMANEGRFHVTVTIAHGQEIHRVEAEVEATYDERPAPILLAIYAVPFVLAGVLWVKLLARRRAVRQATDRQRQGG